MLGGERQRESLSQSIYRPEAGMAKHSRSVSAIPKTSSTKTFIPLNCVNCLFFKPQRLSNSKVFAHSKWRPSDSFGLMDLLLFGVAELLPIVWAAKRLLDLPGSEWKFFFSALLFEFLPYKSRSMYQTHIIINYNFMRSTLDLFYFFFRFFISFPPPPTRPTDKIWNA